MWLLQNTKELLLVLHISNAKAAFGLAAMGIHQSTRLVNQTISSPWSVLHPVNEAQKRILISLYVGVLTAGT